MPPEIAALIVRFASIHGWWRRFEFANLLREGGDAPALEVLRRDLDGLVVGCLEEAAELFVELFAMELDGIGGGRDAAHVKGSWGFKLNVPSRWRGRDILLLSRLRTDRA